MGNNSKSPTMNKLSIILLISLVAFSQAINNYSLRFLAKSADPNERATKWCSLLKEHWSTCTTGGFAPEGEIFNEEGCLSTVGAGLHHGFNCAGDADCEDQKATFNAIKGCKNAIKGAGKALAMGDPNERATKWCNLLREHWSTCTTGGFAPEVDTFEEDQCLSIVGE